MKYRNLCSIGGSSASMCMTVHVDGKTEIEVADFGSNEKTLKFGWSIPLSIQIDRAGMERLYHVIGTALQEMDVEDALPADSPAQADELTAIVRD